MTDWRPFSAAHGLLVAVPQLEDPGFHRAVILMVEHDDRGALGLVLNRVTDHRCDRVVEEFGLAWPGGREERLRRGGPVEPQSLWILHDDGWSFNETLQAGPGVAVSRSREALTRLCEGDADRVRLCVGYAGWGPGQLETELMQGSWLAAPASADLVFEVAPEALWHLALARLGVDPAHLVEGATTPQ